MLVPHQSGVTVAASRFGQRVGGVADHLAAVVRPAFGEWPAIGHDSVEVAVCVVEHPGRYDGPAAFGVGDLMPCHRAVMRIITD
jgi:hypothetical protein